MNPDIKGKLMILAGAAGIIFIGFYDLIMERGYVSFGIFSALALLVCIGLLSVGIYLLTGRK